jgi:hypothetical protein
MTKFVEKIVKIVPSERKGKKYMATIRDNITKKTRVLHFGGLGYEQFKDSTGVGKFTKKNHGDIRRRNNYFSRHSGTRSKKNAIDKEKRLSGGKYTPKLLSHIYLW